MAVVIQPAPDEIATAKQVLAAVLDHIRSGAMIKLPTFDPTKSLPSPDFALVTVGIEDNPFGGTLSVYRYQFEGEEDLLHLIVTKGGADISPAEGQSVASFLLPDIPPALIWLKPGKVSQHFYVGHDELLAATQPT